MISGYPFKLVLSVGLLLVLALIIIMPKSDFTRGFKQSGYENYKKPSFYNGMPNDSFRQIDSIPNEVFFSYVVHHRGYAGVVFNGFHRNEAIAKLVPGYLRVVVQQPSGGLFGSTPAQFNAFTYANGGIVPTVGGVPSRSEMVNTQDINAIYLFDPHGVALPK